MNDCINRLPMGQVNRDRAPVLGHDQAEEPRAQVAGPQPKVAGRQAKEPAPPPAQDSGGLHPQEQG